MPSKKYSILLNKFIPGGSHTYSRGADQFSENAPEILLKGNGQFVYDIAKKILRLRNGIKICSYRL